MKNRLGDVANFTLARVNPGCPAIPLFLVNGLFLYLHLARQLGPNQPVYGIYVEDEVDLQRTKDSLKTRLPVDSVEGLAERYLDKIRAIQPNGPYQLGGECFGGVVAFEVARQLAEQGEFDEQLAEQLAETGAITDEIKLYLDKSSGKT